MKSNDHKKIKENKKQDDRPVKEKDKNILSDHSPAIANTVSDGTKNTASETDGLNQENTDKNELEPGTH